MSAAACLALQEEALAAAKAAAAAAPKAMSKAEPRDGARSDSERCVLMHVLLPGPALDADDKKSVACVEACEVLRRAPSAFVCGGLACHARNVQMLLHPVNIIRCHARMTRPSKRRPRTRSRSRSRGG